MSPPAAITLEATRFTDIGQKGQEGPPLPIEILPFINKQVIVRVRLKYLDDGEEEDVYCKVHHKEHIYCGLRRSIEDFLDAVVLDVNRTGSKRIPEGTHIVFPVSHIYELPLIPELQTQFNLSKLGRLLKMIRRDGRHTFIRGPKNNSERLADIYLDEGYLHV